MTNWNKYLNIPFRTMGRSFLGVDCYGLIVLIFEEEKGIVIPDYTELTYNEDRKNLKEKRDYLLEGLGIKWLRVEDKLQPFDVLVFNKRKDLHITSHVGLYIGNNKFIHALEDSTSEIGKLDNPFWKSKYYGALRWHK